MLERWIAGHHELTSSPSLTSPELFNLRRGSWTHYFRPAEESTAARTSREHTRETYLDIYKDHQSRYLEYIAKAMSEAEHELRNMTAKDKKTVSKVEDMKLRPSTLKQCLADTTALQPFARTIRLDRHTSAETEEVSRT